MFVKINVIYVNLCNKLMLSVLELSFQGSYLRSLAMVILSVSIVIKVMSLPCTFVKG